MNTIRTLIAGLSIVAVISPALADEGVPHDLVARWAAPSKQAPTQARFNAERFVPPYLIGMGEESLVANPAFVTKHTKRATRAEIKTQSIPATEYVGA